MIGENQFAVYQMKQTPETRQMRFCSYKLLQEKGIRIRQEDYEQVYTGILYPQDTPEEIRERLDRKPPQSFAGHSISVSDVLVFNKSRTVISYYVEKTGFTVIDNFIKNVSSPSGVAVSIDTTNFHIEGKAGSWLAFDSIRLNGQEFFLMEHETYGKEAAWLVVDGTGKLAVDNVRNGFDQEVKRELEEYLHPSRPKETGQDKPRQQLELEKHKKSQLHQEEDRSDKLRLNNWQKYMENGEYLRSMEIGEEQNYDMIDGRKNNMPSRKKLKGRQSVLAKLHKKQAEIAIRSRKKDLQPILENDMEREQK